MNIFYLDENPKIAATMHVDKHVVKMILESAQLLSTAHRLLDGDNDIFYKATHRNHPCSKWCRESVNNYNWLYELFCALCDEYTYRYGKIHLTDLKLRESLKQPPKNLTKVGFTAFAQAMPEQYRSTNSVDAYRTYYKKEKVRFAVWTKRNIPEWFTNIN